MDFSTPESGHHINWPSIDVWIRVLYLRQLILPAHCVVLFCVIFQSSRHVLAHHSDAPLYYVVCYDFLCMLLLQARYEALVKLPGDSSVMTYTGHMVKHTLLRARFSPITTTGQVYTPSIVASSILYTHTVLLAIFSLLGKRLLCFCSVYT